MIQLRTLGTIDLRKDGVEVRSITAQPKRLALLVYLAAARPRGFQSRDTLLGLFWPESDEAKARNALRQALHYLRRSLGEDAIVGRGDREVAVDAERVRCDAVDFDRAIEDERWEDALMLYGGDFLPGLFVEDAPEAERWLDEERVRRRREAAAAAWALADRDTGREQWPAATAWARRAHALDPHDEASLRKLMTLLSWSGERAVALEVFAEFERRLKLEFELEPARETVVLADTIRNADAPPLPASAAPIATRETEPVLAASPGPDAVRPPDPPVSTTAASVAETLRPSRGRGDRRAESAGGRRAADRAFEQKRRRRRTVVVTAVIVPLLAVAALLARQFGGRAGAADPIPALAVLPFVNMSGDASTEYFSDGMTEELLNVLAQIPGLRVAARTSSFAFKGRDVPVDSIARALHVTHVLEGSVRLSGPTVRITAQLIDARTGFHLWSRSWDRELEDVFAVQDEIAAAIASSLQPQLAGPSLALPDRQETADPQAHALVLRAAESFRRNTAESYAEAIGLYEEALARDPTYARALAGLANVWVWQSYFRRVRPDEGYPRARALAERALALDSTNVEAHIVLGRVHEVWTWDFAKAEEEYGRASQLNPGEARAWTRRAPLLMRLGRREEALAAARRGTELDPLSPGAHNELGGLYMMLDEPENALAAFRTALALDPGHPILRGNIVLALAAQGRHEEARALAAEMQAENPDPLFAAGQNAYLHARAGRRPEALAALRTLEAADALSPYMAAIILAAVGERQAALDRLDAAVAERDDGVPNAGVDPILRELRDEPRMQAILTRLGLPASAN